MRTFILLIFLFMFCPSGRSQTANFDFERIRNSRPIGCLYFTDSSYYSIDSLTKHSGSYAAKIEVQDPGKQALLHYILPQTYFGKKITGNGYIKTEGVKDGYAGIWIRKDPDLDFNDMRDQDVNGTIDWTRFEISLDVTEAEENSLAVGGLLTGNGKMWIDDLQVAIDGIDIKKLEEPKA